MPGILAVQMIALGDAEVADKLETFKHNLKSKIEKANNDLAQIKFRYKTN